MLDAIRFISANIPLLLQGALVAIAVTLLAVALGLAAGVMVTYMRVYGSKPARLIAAWYEWVLRGTPVLILLFIIYLGLPTVGIDLGGFAAVVIGLGLRSSAYQAQIYRGSILSIPADQTEAGLAIGLSKPGTFRLIVLPQILRLSLPGFTNEFTIVLKDSPLAYAVGIVEILKAGRDITVLTGRPFEIYLACSLLYFALFQACYYIFRAVGRRYAVPGFIFSQ